MFKKLAKHKVKSNTYCVNQFLRKKRHKNWNQECKQNQSILFNFCNIFDLFTSRPQKIAWWAPDLRPDFYIFSYNEQVRKIYRNFIDKFFVVSYLLENSSLKWCNHYICLQINRFVIKFPLVKKLKIELRILCKLSSDTADLLIQTQTLHLKRAPTQNINYRIFSNKRPRRLLNFETVRCCAYKRAALLRGMRLFKS